MFFKKSPTPYLSIWINEADALGIPKPIQKGMLFATGLSYAIDDGEAHNDQKRAAFLRLSNHTKKPGKIGGNFRVDPIMHLLTEMAMKVVPDFEPREMELRSGATAPVFSAAPEPLLPDAPLKPQLAAWAVLAKSLFNQMGEEIGEDEEGSLIAGMLFALSFGNLDMDSTWEVGQAAEGIKPPHMLWPFMATAFSRKQLDQFNPLGKILWVTAYGDEFYNQGLALQFSTAFHYKNMLEPRAEIWNASMRVYVASLIRFAKKFFTDPSIAPAARQCRHLIGLEFEGHDLPLQEAVDEVYRSIMETDGFDLNEPTDGLYFGEMLDRRAVITFEVACRTVKNPDWVQTV